MRLQKGFSIANTLSVLLGLVCVSVILGAYYFIHQTRDNDFEKNIETLNALQQLDAKWSAAILKTRSYTLQDFDQLAFYMIRIREALTLLERQGMLDIQRVGEKTVNQYQIYKNSFQVKNEAVEHYKSQQAILRNSVRYLPDVSDDVQQLLAGISTLKSKELSSLVVESNLLINQFLLAAVGVEKVQKTLDELEQQSAEESSVIEDKVQGYLTHAQLIMKYKPKTIDMLNTAMSGNIGELSTNVIYEYTQTQNVLKQRIKRLQEVMLAGSVLLLLIMLWFLLRLRKSNAEIVIADAEKEVTKKQLLQANAKIGTVNKHILQAERHVASSQLAMGALRHVQKITPRFSEHSALINQLKTMRSLEQHEKQLQTLNTDITDIQNELNELDVLLNPQENFTKQVNFDFNDIIKKAVNVVLFEEGTAIEFSQQLSDMPPIQASSVDIFQIVLKLFRQAIIASKSGDKNIFIKTWATGRYANMYMALSNHNDLELLYSKETLIVVRELIEQNQGILKLTPKEDDTSGMIWISFPYNQ